MKLFKLHEIRNYIFVIELTQGGKTIFGAARQPNISCISTLLSVAQVYVILLLYWEHA